MTWPDALATLSRAWERSPLGCAALGLAGVLGLVAGHLWLGHLEDASRRQSLDSTCRTPRSSVAQR